MPHPFARAGSLRPAYDAVDWAATPFGPLDAWSPALLSAVDLLLDTRFAITLFWGPEFAMLYNEAYVEMIDGKHPASLGAPAHEVFPEAWHLIGPMMRDVVETGEASWVEDEYVPLLRSGYLEECYFTFSYSPVRSAEGIVEGVMDIATETTAHVLGRRRLSLLSELGAALAEVDDVCSLHESAVAVLQKPDLSAIGLWVPGCGHPEPADGLRDVQKDLVLSDDGTRAWLRLPVTHDALQGARLAVVLNPRLRLDDDYRDLLLLVAASLARAADRIVTMNAERSLSAALQVSLLTEPAQVPGVDIAVRYLPAAELAQIGGDWYDSFRMPDRSLALVVGDVAGHDEDAAATMAQLRNLTRGVAQSVASSPAAVLGAVDSALRGLDVPAVATAVVALLAEDRRSARVASAGHMPALLIDPDGSARLLDVPPDLLLGLDPGLPRVDHEVALGTGATLVLYTDGLVERRGVPIQQSLDWLVEVAAGRHDLDAEQLADHLLSSAGPALEDDVALLVLRLR